MNLLFNFVRHIGNMGAASAPKRVAYAFGNILLMAFAVFFAVCVKWSWGMMFSETFLGGLILVIVSIAATIIFFLQGFVGQIALIFIAGIGSGNPEGRGCNIAACVIALVTVVGLVIAAIVLLSMS